MIVVPCTSTAPIGMPPSARPRSASSTAARRNSSMAAILPHRHIRMVTLKQRSLPSVLAAFGLLVVLAVTMSSQPAPPQSLTMLSRDGKRPLAITMVGDQEFVALDDLASTFQLTVHQESFGAITVSYKGRTIILTPEQSLASVAGRLI